MIPDMYNIIHFMYCPILYYTNILGLDLKLQELLDQRVDIENKIVAKDIAIMESEELYMSGILRICIVKCKQTSVYMLYIHAGKAQEMADDPSVEQPKTPVELENEKKGLELDLGVCISAHAANSGYLFV